MAQNAGPAPATSTKRAGSIAALFPTAAELAEYARPRPVFVTKLRGTRQRHATLDAAFGYLSRCGCHVEPEHRAAAAALLVTPGAYQCYRYAEGVASVGFTEDPPRTPGFWQLHPAITRQQTGQDRANTYYQVFVPDGYTDVTVAVLEQALGWDSGYWGARLDGQQPVEGGTKYTFACYKD